MIDEKIAPNSALDVLAGHHGGITHIRFGPDGNFLYTGARTDSSICCWDLRNMNKCLFTSERKVTTNQRITFDLDATGKYLVSGNEDGEMIVYDVQLLGEEIARYKIQQQDAMNSVMFHPFYPLLAAASGERRPPLQPLVEEPSVYVFKAKYEMKTISVPLATQEQQPQAMEE